MRPRYREAGFAGTVRTVIRTLADLFSAYRHLPNMVELPDCTVWVRISDGNGPPLVRLRLPDRNEFLEEDDCREVRQETALEMMDDDVYGYMLFLLKREEDGGADLVFRTQTNSKWIGTFTSGFSRVLDGIQGDQVAR